VPAAVALEYATDINNGTYDTAAVPWLVVGGLLTITAIALAKVRFAWLNVVPILGVLLGLAILTDFLLALRNLPVHESLLKIKSVMDLMPYLSGVGIAAVLAGAIASGRPFLLRATFPSLLIAFFAMSLWIVRNTEAHIDVFVFQFESTRALGHGQNPYAMTFVDPYGGRSPWYGPGLSVNGRLQFGYPYFPLSLFLAMPGQWCGDVRYSHAVAVLLAGALIGYCANTRISFSAAAVMLFLSRTMFVIEQSWIECFAVLTLALVAFTARRIPRAMPYALGLFFASKQYLPLAAPLALLLCDWPLKGKQVWGVAWRAMLAGAIVTLPLALWNWPAFWHSTVRVQMMAPFRTDGLSLLAWLYDPTGGGASLTSGPPSGGIAFIMMLVAMVLSLFCAPRNIVGFCGAVAVSFLAFFAFNKQAFMNYYFFVIGAICCAIAVAAPKEPRCENAPSLAA
jgi:hypothetical protein